MTTPMTSEMEEERPHLLFVAGESETLAVLERLRGSGLESASERVSTPEALKAALEQPWDLVLCGAELAGLGFQEVAPLLRERAPTLAFLVLTPRWNEAELGAALEAGAQGYVDLERLAQVELEIRREVRRASERRHYQQLQQQRQSRPRFLSDLNHELRSPLNSIIGYCDLLIREEGSQLTPHGRHDLGVVKKSAQSLLALINDALELFKLEAGRVEVERELVNLRELAADCAREVRMYLAGKDVELITQLDERVLLVRADALKLRKVLYNLLSNAARTTESGEIVLSARAEDKEAVFVVEDTGKGIPAEQLPSLFEKFHQVEDASARKAGSTALGLALVQELTRVMGGTVSVRSTLGHGTTFTVRLPCIPEDEEALPSSPVAPLP